MRFVVAITAASGAIYARLTIERLLASPCVSEIALVCSRHAREVMAHEGVSLPVDGRIREYANDDMFAPPASGSARYDGMAVVPSTVGTVGRVAAGTAQSLIERAADVMLKERRRLVFVVRETPLSLIHLRNMAALTEAGAVILPASPSFYAAPQGVEELCGTVADRAAALLGVDISRYEWGIEMDGKTFQIVDFQHVKPGKGPAFVRTKLKNLESGRVLDNTFSAGAKIEPVRVERRPYQFTYEDDLGAHFMHTETFEEINIDKNLITNYDLMADGQIVEVMFHTEKETVLSAELPPIVDMEVTYTEPGIKGDTASTNSLKPATVNTGATVRVPLFINTGDKIRVDTRTREYYERIK